MAFSSDTFTIINIHGYGDYVKYVVVKKFNTNSILMGTYFAYLFENRLVGSGTTASIGLSNKLPMK